MAALENQGIETLLMDYTEPTSIAALVDTVAARTNGRIDALFNNGAYGQPGAVEDLSRLICYAASLKRTSLAGMT